MEIDHEEISRALLVAGAEVNFEDRRPSGTINSLFVKQESVRLGPSRFRYMHLGGRRGSFAGGAELNMWRRMVSRLHKRRGYWWSHMAQAIVRNVSQGFFFRQQV